MKEIEETRAAKAKQKEIRAEIDRISEDFKAKGYHFLVAITHPGCGAAGVTSWGNPSTLRVLSCTILNATMQQLEKGLREQNQEETWE